MTKFLRKLMSLLITAVVASLLVQVAYWNMWVGIILITLLIIGSMFLGVGITVRLFRDGELEFNEGHNIQINHGGDKS